MKTEPEHKDRLGRILKQGDPVAYPHGNSLLIGLIIKLTPKMVRMKQLGDKSWRSEHTKYPSEVVLLEGPDVMMHILRAGPAT